MLPSFLEKYSTRLLTANLTEEEAGFVSYCQILLLTFTCYVLIISDLYATQNY